MRTRPLGTTTLTLSTVGLGCMGKHWAYKDPSPAGGDVIGQTEHEPANVGPAAEFSESCIGPRPERVARASLPDPGRESTSQTPRDARERPDSRGLGAPLPMEMRLLRLALM
jgi:hypothetical protein